MVVQKIIQEHTRLLKISGNESCENLLTELADYVIHENLAKQGFTKALLERERNFPTGIKAFRKISASFMFSALPYILPRMKPTKQKN